MSNFKIYDRKVKTGELRPVTQDDIDWYDHKDHIPDTFQPKWTISIADDKNGSPKLGDMIARNPDDHSDQWLVSEEYFKNNFVIK